MTKLDRFIDEWYWHRTVAAIHGYPSMPFRHFYEILFYDFEQ